MAIAVKPFSFMRANTSNEKSFYTQGQQRIARILLAAWLLASGSPEGALATPKRQMVPATTTSPGDPSLASAPPTLPPGGAFQLPPDFPGAFWGGSVATSPSIDAALQQRMSQEALPFIECDLLRTFPKVTSVEEHLSFQARGGESVRFACQMGQWHAEVSSHIGAFSRRTVLPVVCSQGTDVTSSLEVLSKYPSWYSQRHIYILDRNLCPTLGEVIYVGELGLKGGSGGEASGSGEQRGELPSVGPRSYPVALEPSLSVAYSVQGGVLDALAGQATSSTVVSVSQVPTPVQPLSSQDEGGTQPLVNQLKTLASDPQIDQQPEQLAQLGGVLLKLAKAKQEEAGDSAQDLSLYTDAAILYQHVLSICEPKAGMLGSQEASTLVQSAYQGLAQIQASMLARAKGVAPRATTSESVKALRARIEEDKRSLEATRTKARKEVEDLVKYRDKQGSEREVQDAEAIFIKDSIELFETIAEASKDLLANFYQAGEEELKAARIERPCTYAIMGLGSVALQQTTPYSDLEFAILMEDAQDEAAARTYLRNLTHLVHFRVINLGETVLPFSEYKISLDHLGRKGLNFDLGGKTPLGRKDKRYELIQPVSKMAAYMQNEGGKMEQMDKLLPYILESTCYIYGDSSLHKAYEATQASFLQEQAASGQYAYQQRIAKKLLQGVKDLGRQQPGDISRHRPSLDPIDAGKLYNVKEEIYRLADRLLYGLAFYYGLRPQSVWDAVDQLLASNRIHAEAARHLKYMASFSAMLRLETYLYHGQQNEQLSLRGSLPQGASGEASSQAAHKLLMLPPAALQEDGSLFRYYYTALPLHQQMEEFFELLHLRQQMRGKPVLDRALEAIFGTKGKYAAPQEGAYFRSDPFYDTSCAVKVSAYHRLQQYEAAKDCAAKHHEEVKKRYFFNHAKLARYHHNLGVTYCHLGSIDGSFEHFDTARGLLEGVYRDGHPEIAKVLRSQGIAYYTRKNFEQSRQCFAESLQLLQAFYNDNHPETAQMLLSLGEVYQAMGNFQESLDYKEQSLEMLQSLYAAQPTEQALAWLSFREACRALKQSLGSSSDPETALKNAYAAWEQLLYERPHPEIARTLLSLGDAYAALENCVSSLKHKEASLSMFRALYGRSHPQVARALLSLGDADAALGNFSSSEQHKKEALSMFRDLYGSSHPEVARTLLSLGEMHALNGKLEESLKHKEDSWKMFQAFYREDHPEVVRALGSLNETRGRHIQGEGSARQDTGHALRPVRTVYPQHLTLLSTPRHGKEPAGENTLLRNYYQHKTFACVPSLLEEQRSKHVKDLECQLMLREQKLVQEDQDKKEDKEDEGDKEQAEGSKQEDQVASHHTRLEEVKTPIDLQDLFKKRSIKPGEPAKEIQRILLTGDPGTGKTTVSKQLAYQWAAGTWGQEFYALYLLPVRKLQQGKYDNISYRREETLATAIANNCLTPPSNEDEYKRLRDHIEQELQKPTTLVILDGLDERGGASQEILKQAQAGSHKLLMLSQSHEIDKNLTDIQIEHAGFSEDQLQAYVLAELQEHTELAKGLLGDIQKHKPIYDIAHVPGYLKILCRYKLEQGSLPGLYSRVIQWVCQRPGKYASLGGRPISIPARCSASQLADWCKSIYQELKYQPQERPDTLTTQHPHLTQRSIAPSLLLIAVVVPLLSVYFLPDLKLGPLSPAPPPIPKLCDQELWAQCLALETSSQQCSSQMPECCVSMSGLAERLKTQEIANAPQLSSYILLAKLTHFVERPSITEQLSATLSDNGVCVLHGFGGVGKSTLAAHYGHGLKDTQAVRWISAEDSRKLREGYEQLAQELGVDYQPLATKLAADDSQYHQELARMVYNALDRNHQPTLLILDNAEDASLVADYLLHRPAGLQTIITTRSAEAFEGTYTQLQLGAFSQDQGEGYLEVRFKEMKRPYTNPEVASLLKEVGLVAQKLNLATGYLQANKLVTIAQYIARLQALKQAGTKQQGRLTLPEVALGLETLTREGQQLMQYAAYLDADFIPLSLVSVLLDEEDPEQLSEVANDLSRLSLMQVVSTQEGQELGLQVHREVQASCREYERWSPEAALGTRETILSRLAEVLKAQMPEVESVPDDSWKQARLYAPHVTTVVKALEDSGAAPSAVVAKLLALMGEYSKVVGLNYRQAVSYYERSLAIKEQVYQETPNHPSIAMALNNLGAAWLALGDGRQAVSYYDRALAIFEQSYQETPNHPEIASTLNNLGAAWSALGDARQAVSYYDRALAIFEQSYQETPNHPDIARTLNNLGAAWVDLGDARQAVSYYDRALAIFEQSYQETPNHPDIASTLNNLGNAWVDLGDARQAVSFYDRALAMREQVYQETPNHPDIAMTLNNLGAAWGALGDGRQAVSYYERSLAIYEQVYQETPNHPDIARTLNNLGNAWQVLGDARQAVSFYQRALAIKEQVYHETPNHPEIATTLNNLGNAWQVLGDGRQAVSFLERALAIREQVYQATPNHPDIARTLNNLGTAWADLGDGRQAVSYYERSLAIKEQVYQETANHPDIARTLNNLGTAWSDLGDGRQAVSYYDRALAIYEQSYQETPNHPDIARTLNNLGAAWVDLGDARQAVSYYDRALAIFEQSYQETPNHPDIASTLNNLGNAWVDLGDARQAVSFYDRALAMREQVYQETPNHPDIAMTLNNLGAAWRALGDARQAVSYYDRALAMREQSYQETPNHPDIARTLVGLGIAWRALGDARQAVSYYDRALAIYEQSYQETPNHPSIAMTLNNLGAAWRALGDARQAVSFLERALAIYEQVYQATPNHPHIAMTLGNLGAVWADLGDRRQALEYHQQALAMYQALHEGGNHADVAEAFLAVGFANYYLGRLEEVIQNWEQALAVPAVSQATKVSTGHNLGCMCHVKALAARQEGDEPRAQAYLEKATASFEQAVQASDWVEAGLYTEYGNFLLDTRKAAQAYDYLYQVIESGDDEVGLQYGLLEQPTVTPVLQAYISQQQKVQLRGIDYAYYLMIHHYEDFQKVGIAMAQTRDAYLAAYKASIDQCSGRPGKAQADKTAYHLLGSLYEAQGDDEAADAAFARAQDGTEQEATQTAA